MPNIMRDVPVKSGQVSPNKMVDIDQAQNRTRGEDGRSTTVGTATSKATRMRFAICTLGLVSLTMGQISRTVINYSITSMVHPKILYTNSSISNGGGSCPIRAVNSKDEKSLVRPPEVLVPDDDREYLIELLNSVKHPEYHQSDSLEVESLERIYTSGRSLDQESTITSPIEENPNQANEDKFMWTVEQQSLIKGGFFYSYFFFMIIGGRIAEIYGAKYVILIGVAGSAIINLATPWMARNSLPMLILSRIIMGTIQSAGFPALYALINRWLTMSEASIYAPMCKMSIRVGQVLASMSTGLIPGWSNQFYLVGLLGIVWSIFWVFLSTSDPSENKWVSEPELEHIMKNKKTKRKKIEATSDTDNNKTSSSLKTPWLKIITSPSVIGLVIAKYAFSLCNSFITIELPSYLSYVYHATMQEMSAITTVMFATQIPLTLLAGWMAKVMVQKHPLNLSTTNIRKMFQGLATIGSGCSLLLMTLSDCNLVYTGILLQIVSFFAVWVAGGETMLPYDLSEEYPATIMAIANSFSNLSGITVTSLTGLLLSGQGGSQSHWNTVILVVAALDIFGGLMFCLMVKAEPIDFDDDKENPIEDGYEKRGSVSQPEVAHSDTLRQQQSPANLADLTIQTSKADELMSEAKIDHLPAVYSSNSGKVL